MLVMFVVLHPLGTRDLEFDHDLNPTPMMIELTGIRIRQWISLGGDTVTTGLGRTCAECRPKL